MLTHLTQHVIYIYMWSDAARCPCSVCSLLSCKQCARVPPKFYLMNLPRRVCHRSSKAVTPKPRIPEHTGLQNLREKAENAVALRRTSSNLCLPGLTPWLVDGWKMARPPKVGHRNGTSFEMQLLKDLDLDVWTILNRFPVKVGSRL